MTTKVIIEDAEPIGIPADLAGDDRAIVAAITPYQPQLNGICYGFVRTLVL